jgi:hypothetical protein
MSVALIGSSGGGAATLGHTDPLQLLQTIHKELLKIQGCQGIRAALFISLHGGKGLDSACEKTDTATLYEVSYTESKDEVDAYQVRAQVVHTGSLGSANEKCREADFAIAKLIRERKIAGLISISINVDIHAETLKAAAELDIPVTGSGGTGLSAASTRFGVRLVGNAGGSVATTSYTRAVSYSHALAVAWGRINILYGDFIEAAYPFMERSTLLNVSGYLASGMSTELLTKNPQTVQSLAYLPVPISIWLASDWKRISVAYFVAFCTSLLGTLVNNLLFGSKMKIG